MGTVEPIKDLEHIVKMKEILGVKRPRDALLFSFGINSGLRISDIVALDVKDVTPKTHDESFPYQGLIRCKICNGLLSPELKKSKYIYYHCNDYNKKGCKKKSYINQNIIDKAITNILKNFVITQKLLNDIIGCIKEIHNEKNAYEEHKTSEINKELKRIQKRIEDSYIDKCDGKLDEESWITFNRRFHAQKKNF